MNSEVQDEFRNYFNYFTEVEEHFQRARGTSLFLMSPLDWALLESWKNAGIPLAAVLRGIDVAFEKWRARPRQNKVNSLAYCAQAVAQEAKAMAEGVAPKAPQAAPFGESEVAGYLAANARALRNAGFDELAASLEKLDPSNLEELEQRLTALEDKLLALLRSKQSEDELFEARRELDASLRPYRGKLTAEQLAMLEKQYLDRRLFERANLPRLSLFYLT